MSKITFNRGERQKPVTPDYLKNWEIVFGKKQNKDLPTTPANKGDNNE